MLNLDKLDQIRQQRIATESSRPYQVSQYDYSAQPQPMFSPEYLRSLQIRQEREAGNEPIARALEQQGQISAGGFWKDALARAGQAIDSYNLQQEIFDAANVRNDPERAEQLRKLQKRVQEINAESQKDDTSGFLGTMAGVVGPIYQSIKESIPGVLGGAAVGLAVGGPGGALVGAGRGLLASSFLNWSRQGGGDIYSQLKDQGITHENAKVVSTAGGLIYGAIEQIATVVGVFQPGLVQPFKNYLTRELNKSIIRAAGKYATNVIGETTEEALQEGVMRVAYNTAADMQDNMAADGSPLVQLTGTEIMGSMLEAAKESVLPIMVLGGAGGAIDLQRARSTDVRIKDMESQYKKLVPAANDQTFERIYEQAANERANTQVPLGADKPATVDVYMQKLQQGMGEIREQQATQKRLEQQEINKESKRRRENFESGVAQIEQEPDLTLDDMVQRLERFAADAEFQPEIDDNGNVKRPAWKVAVDQFLDKDATVYAEYRARGLKEARQVYVDRLEQAAQTSPTRAEDIKKDRRIKARIFDSVYSEYKEKMGDDVFKKQELKDILKQDKSLEELLAEYVPDVEVSDAVPVREAAEVPVGERAEAGPQVDETVREQAAPEVQAQIASTFVLPRELARSAPRYGMASLQFANDYDKTAYILARDAVKPSKSAEKFRAALTAQGLNVDEAIAHGGRVLAQIKSQVPGAAPSKAQTINVEPVAFEAQRRPPEEPPEAGAAPAPVTPPVTPPPEPVRVTRLEQQPDGTEAEVEYEKVTAKSGRQGWRKIDPQTGAKVGAFLSTGKTVQELEALETGREIPRPPPPPAPARPMTTEQAAEITGELERRQEEAMQPTGITPALGARQELNQLNRRERELRQVDIDDMTDAQMQELEGIIARKNEILGEGRATEAERAQFQEIIQPPQQPVQAETPEAPTEPEVLPATRTSEFDVLAQKQRQQAIAQRKGAVAEVQRKLGDEEIVARLQNPDEAIRDLLPSQESPAIREIKPLVQALGITQNKAEKLLRQAGYTIERGTRRITGLPTLSAERSAQEGRAIEAAGAGQVLEGVTEETPETLAEKFDDVKAAMALMLQRKSGRGSKAQLAKLEEELSGVTLNGRPITRATPEELRNAALESLEALGQEVPRDVAQAITNLGLEPTRQIAAPQAQLPALAQEFTKKEEGDFNKFSDRVDDAVANLASPSTLRSITKSALDKGYIDQRGHDEVLRVQRSMGTKDDTSDAFSELQSLINSYGARFRGAEEGRRFQTQSVTGGERATQQNVAGWARGVSQKIAGSRWTEDRTTSDTVGHLRIGTKSIRFVLGDAGTTPEGQRAAGFVQTANDGEYTILIDRQTGTMSTPQHELGHIMFDSLTDGQKSALNTALGYDISTRGGQERFVSENLESDAARNALADRILGLSVDQRSVVVRAINAVIRGLNAMLGTNIQELGRGARISALTAVDLSNGLRDFSLILQHQRITDSGAKTFVEKENARSKEIEQSWIQTLKDNNFPVETRFQTAPTQSIPYDQFEREYREGSKWKDIGKDFLKFHRNRKNKSQSFAASYDKWIQTGALKSAFEAKSMEQAARREWQGRLPEKRNQYTFMSGAREAARGFYQQFGMNIRNLSRSISKEQGDWVDNNLQTEVVQTFKMRAEEIIDLAMVDKDRFNSDQERNQAVRETARFTERWNTHEDVTTDFNGLLERPVDLKYGEYYQVLRYLQNDTGIRGAMSGLTILDQDRPIPLRTKKFQNDKEKMRELRDWAKEQLAADPDFAKLSEAQNKISDVLFPEINEVYKRLFPESQWPTPEGLKREEFYTAIHRDVKPNVDAKNRNRLVSLLKELSSLKKREEYSQKPLIITDGLQDLYQSISKSANFIGNAEFTTNYRRMLGQDISVEEGASVEPSTYGQEIIRLRGQKFFDNLLESIDQVEGTTYDVNNVAERGIQNMMRWIARGALTGPTTVAMQGMALFIPLVRYNSDVVMSGYMSRSKGVTKEFLEEMARNSRHGGAIMHRLAHRLPIEEAQRATYRGKINRFNKAIDRLDRIGFAPMRYIDRQTVFGHGRIAWESVQRDMPSASQQEKADEFVKRWNDMLQYQMTGDPSMKVLAHNKGGFGSVLNMFRSTVNAQYLKIAESYMKAKQSGDADAMREFYSRVGLALVSMTAYATLIRMGSGVARDFFADLFGDDEDKKRISEDREYEKTNRYRLIAKEFITNLAAQAPITTIGSGIVDLVTEYSLLDRRDFERYASQSAANRVHPLASVVASGANTIEAVQRLTDAFEAYNESPTPRNEERKNRALRNMYKASADFLRYTPASTPLPIWSNFLSIDKALFNLE